MAIPGGRVTSSTPFEKVWEYNVRISNTSRDTVLKFQSKFLIYLPIIRYNSSDTLIAYKNVSTTLTVDYPLYKNLLIEKKIFFTTGNFDTNVMNFIPTDSVDIIETTDTTVTFISRKNTPFFNIRIGTAGINLFATKTYKVIEMPDPKIISPISINSIDGRFNIELEASDEFKYFGNENSKFLITDGFISAIRKGKIINTQNINNRNLNFLKKGDTILVQITECEMITFGKKQNLKLNLFKLIPVQ